MPEVLPDRITADQGVIYLRLAQFSGGVYQVPSAADLAISSQIFGPFRNAEVNDPIHFMKQTAYGDPGDEQYPARKGTWEASIEAAYDISDGVTVVTILGGVVYGDYRWGSLMHQTVDFLIGRYEYGVSGSIVGMVMGVGTFQGGVVVPAAEGGSIIRNVRITRRFGGVAGNLRWANARTGAFA